MKRLLLVLVATTVLLACSLPSGLTAPEAPAPTGTSIAETSTPTVAPTDTPIPPTAIPPSPTSAPPVIEVESAGRLSNFMTLGEGEVVRDLEFSPDGKALVSVAGNNSDFAIRLWEVGSGLPVRSLQGHTSIVWGVAFSPDGKMLASASKDGTAKVWDWRSGELLESLNFPSEVTSVAFSPDSQTLAVGGVDGSPNAAVWTYSVASWQPLMTLTEFWNIPAMAYSPDGSLLVGGGTSRNVRVWRTSDGVPMFILYHSGQVSSVTISPDGSKIATGLCQASEDFQCTRGAVWLWDLQRGTLIKRLADFPDWVQGVAFSVDGSVLIAGSRDGMLRAYTTADYQPVFASTSPFGVQALSVSPDGRLLATGNNRGEVELWRVEP